MQTVVLNNPGQLALIDRPQPTSPGPGEALVKVMRVGVCGTDIHAFRGKQPFFSYPRVLGHELGVEVLSLGPGQHSVAVGDRCAVEPYLNCGTCIACRNGKTNCCTQMRVLGVHVDGGMCSQLVLPSSKLHRSPKLSFDQLALVETLGIGAHAVHRAQVRADEWALIIGAGPIGLAALQFVIAVGARPIVMEPNASRADFCRRAFGVTHLIDPNNDPVTQLHQITDGDMPTVVFDATGNPGSMMKSFSFPAHGGRLVFIGLFVGDVTFHDPDFHRRELTLLASRNSLPDDFTRIIKLVEDGVVSTLPWITHRAALVDLPGKFSQWVAPDSGVLKAVVEVP
jgi:2-desacetyl-2-hydroxyethyl bacteriochlorophyllide A dehydrogenase